MGATTKAGNPHRAIHQSLLWISMQLSAGFGPTIDPSPEAKLKVCHLWVLLSVRTRSAGCMGAHNNTPGSSSLNHNGSSGIRLTGTFGLDPSREATIGVQNLGMVTQNPYYLLDGWPNFFETLYSDMYLKAMGMWNKTGRGEIGLFKVEV